MNSVVKLMINGRRELRIFSCIQVFQNYICPGHLSLEAARNCASPTPDHGAVHQEGENKESSKRVKTQEKQKPVPP